MPPEGTANGEAKAASTRPRKASAWSCRSARERQAQAPSAPALRSGVRGHQAPSHGSVRTGQPAWQLLSALTQQHPPAHSGRQSLSRGTDPHKPPPPPGEPRHRPQRPREGRRGQRGGVPAHPRRQRGCCREAAVKAVSCHLHRGKEKGTHGDEPTQGACSLAFRIGQAAWAAAIGAELASVLGGAARSTHVPGRSTAHSPARRHT